MDNQHKKIKGYRDLSQEEIDAMNLCKEKANELKLLCDKISNIDGIDEVWLNEAIMAFKKGSMYIVRSIAKPKSF